MKQIKGKKYYVSLGYMDKEAVENGINAKDIQSIWMKYKAKDRIALYVDDSDIENVISLPLLRVNDIQKKDDIFKFMVLVSPYSMHFDEDEDMKKLNVIGLFEEYKKDGIEYIKHIAFYTLPTTKFILKRDKAFPMVVEADVNKIMGENENEK